MKTTGLLIVLLALASGGAQSVSGKKETTPRRFLGTGEEILHGRGTRVDPFNKPKNDAHRALVDAISHREVHHAHLREELAKIQGRPRPQPRRLRGRGSKLRRARALQETTSDNSSDSSSDDYDQTNDDYSGEGLLNLDECWRISELGDDLFGNLTELHPCYNQMCQRRKSSEECLDLVYDFCCDPSLEDCQPSDDMKQLRTQASCTGETCSRFMGDTYSYTDPGDVSLEQCYFSNATLCENECSWRVWDMMDSYVWNSCEWNMNCFANQLWEFEPELQVMSDQLSAAASKARRAARSSARQGARGSFFTRASTSGRRLISTSICTEDALKSLFAMVAEAELATCYADTATEDTCAGSWSCMESITDQLGITLQQVLVGSDELPAEILCWDDILRSGSYDEFTGVWPESAGQTPSEDDFNVLEIFIDAIGECMDSDFFFDGYGEEGNYYANYGGDDWSNELECAPEALMELLGNFEASGIRECVGDFNTTTCTTMYGCMPSVQTLLGAETADDLGEDNPLLLCAMRLSYLGDFDKIWPEGVTKPSADVIAYTSFVYQGFMNCEEYDHPLGDMLAENWNYGTNCLAVNQGNLTTCKDTCCELHENILTLGNISAFPTDPSKAGFTCGQMIRAGEPKEDVLACLRLECGGCYKTGTGLYGPPGFEQGKGNDNPYNDGCIEGVYTHCTNNPEDTNCKRKCPFEACDSRKNDDCPCGNEGCAAFYGSDFADSQPCSAVHKAVTRAFVQQNHMYPESYWTREYLEAVSGVKLTPPDGFVLPAEVEQLAAEKGCNLLDEIVACVNSTTQYCNSDSGFWSSGCRQTSECGDGVLAWGEVCDDGNQLPIQDGCRECTWVPDGWYCPEPGLPCEVCVRDPNVDQYRPARPGLGTAGRASEETGCPFCMNRRLDDRLNPCLSDECKAVSDYPSALACDEVVADYCGALAAKSMHDPGCAAYVNKSKAFAVPKIPTCTFTKRSMDVHGEYLKKISYMVIECPIVDPTGQGMDVTPMVPYWSPMFALSDDEFSGLEAETQKILEIKTLAEEDELVPITTLTDFETNPYDDTRVFIEENSMRRAISEYENPFRQRAARLHLNGAEFWEQDECEWPNGFRELYLLPPCDDEMATVARQGLKELKFRAVINEDWDFRDFAGVSTTDVSKFMCNPKRNTVQLTIPISRTRLEWVSGTNQEVERPEYSCERYYRENNYTWPDREDDCDTFESLFQNNHVKVSFGQMLYQQGCLDDTCEEQIAKCELVPLEPASPKVDLEMFAAKGELLLDTILEISGAQSWAEVKKSLVTVSALAASSPISAALDLFNSVTVQGSVTKYLKDVRYYCPHDWGYWNSTTRTYEQNPEWLEDPCCNWELQYLMCCPIQDVPSGKVSTITGFDEDKLDVCQNPDMIKQTFTNLFSTIAVATKQAAELARKVDPKEFENIWEFEDECRELIYKSKDVQTEADCYCKYSSVRDSQCVTAPADMPRCYAECFRSKYEDENPYVLFYLKEQWGIAEPESEDVDDENDRFADAWVEHMTEEGCAGDEEWREDIGYSGYRWMCNETCQEEHACDYWAVFYRFIEARNRETGQWLSEWEVRNSDELCAEFNGTRECSYQVGKNDECYDYRCRIPELFESYEMPCEALRTCDTDCYAPCYDQGYCEANNGTWIEEQSTCCPAHGFVHENEWGKECKLTPPGAPDSWSLRDEICCSAHDGHWRRNEWGGECCLGEWREYEWDGNVYSWCSEHVDTWGECSKCYEETCEPLMGECYSCWRESEDCCGEEYVGQNKTACLSYTRCNDRERSEYNCDGDEAFCSYEWGGVATEPAMCEFYLWDTEEGHNQQSCEDLGFQWLTSRWGWEYCGKELPPNATAEECFGISECVGESWEKRFPGWEAPANGFWDHTYCDAGCFISDSSEYVTHTEHYEWGYSGCSYEIELSNGETVWAGGRWNEEQGACLVYSWDLRQMVDRSDLTSQSEACAFIGGSHNLVSGSFNPARYATQEQCETGRCEGTVNDWRRHPETGHWSGDQPWTEEQCFRLSDKQCDRWCPTCRTEVTEHRGGCYHNETFEPIDIDSEEGCLAGESQAWFSCPVPEVWLDDWNAVNDVCRTNGDNIPEQVFNSLNCWPDYQRCDEERCEEIGDCMNIHGHVFDFRTYHCTDPSWQHGDRFWGEEIVEGDGYSYTSWVSCDYSMREEIQGVCIGDRDADYGCGYDKWYLWHTLGCKQEGVYTQEDCENLGKTWYTPIRRPEDCSIPGCRLNRWDVREYTESECQHCGGEVVDMAYWQGGNLMKPFMRKYKWYPNGREIVSVNEWIPRQAPYLLQQELEVPVMRAFAQFKMQELLVKYNLYSKVLETIACDCSGADGGADGSCFASQENGVLRTSQELPLGQTTEAGSGVTVMTSLNMTAARRMLAEGETEKTSVAVTEYSAGVYAKHEPCVDDDASSFDAFKVVNEHGMVVGQLLGNGRGINISGAVDSVLLCMPARDDISLRDSLFDVFAVGERAEDGSVTPVLFEDDDAIYVERTASQVCIETTASAVYYPIARVADDLVPTSTSCSSGCDQGTCVLDKNGETQCVCKCGFSGDACDVGCPSYCNGNGACNQESNECECTQGNTAPLFVGTACGRKNCPVNAAGVSCSGNGYCSVDSGDAVCVCNSGWLGTECSTQDGGNTTGADIGYGELVESEDYGEGFAYEVDTSPVQQETLAPSPAPTPAPTKPAAEPLVTLKVQMSSNILASSANNSDISETFNALKTELTKVVPENLRDKVDIKIQVKQKTKGSLDLSMSEALNDESLGLIERSIEVNKCLGATACNVTVWLAASSPARRQLVETASIEFSIEKTISEDETDVETDDTIEPSELTNLISAQAAAEGVEVEISVDNAPTPVVESSLVVQAIPKESALQSLEEAQNGEAFDVTSLQQSMSNAEALTAAVESSTGVTVSSIEQDLCEGRTCSGHGTCVEDTEAGTSSCECAGSWSGVQCEVGTSAPTPSPTASPTVDPTGAPSTAQPTSPPSPTVIDAAAHSGMTSFTVVALLVALAAAH